jgi:hypothetical protein
MDCMYVSYVYLYGIVKDFWNDRAQPIQQSRLTEALFILCVHRYIYTAL